MDIKKNIALKKYTTFRVGGNAKIFFTPNSIAELQLFLKTNIEKVLFLGLGSNSLIDDSGFDGVVISTKNLKDITQKNNLIIAEAGVSLHKLNKFATANKQSGGNFLIAIPGSVGGALKMNAGCFGKEFWDYVKSVKTIDKSGNIFIRQKSDFVINYRNVCPKYIDEFFIQCELKFDNNQLDVEVLDKRYASQPIGTANCGSVFKNPKNDFAARLIEESGLKNYCIGGACVSDKHANFIINNGNATSKNIIDLISYIQQKVKDKFNILLESEVVIHSDLKKNIL